MKKLIILILFFVSSCATTKDTSNLKVPEYRVTMLNCNGQPFISWVSIGLPLKSASGYIRFKEKETGENIEMRGSIVIAPNVQN